METTFPRLKQKITSIPKNEILSKRGRRLQNAVQQEANLENQLIKISNVRAKRKYLSDCH